MPSVGSVSSEETSSESGFSFDSVKPSLLRFEDEDDEVYEPSKERTGRSKRRSKKTTVEKSRNKFELSEWITISDRRYSPYLPQVSVKSVKRRLII